MEAVSSITSDDQKTCSKCFETKTTGDFYYWRSDRKAPRKECKECVKAKSAERYLHNKPAINRQKKIYAQKQKLKIADYQRKYQKTHRKEISEQKKLYNVRKRDQINERRKKRLATDPVFRMRKILSGRIRDAIRGKCMSLGTLKLLGCSLRDFVIYLESRFEPGMSWDNYGKHPGWHVDHIMPCAIFDLTKFEHQKRCFHFSNMQPMWAAQNQTKSAKVLTNQFNLL